MDGPAATALVTLFTVVDPVGTTPLFIALTQGMTARARRRVALRALAVAAVVLTLFGLAGGTVLDLIGISMPAFRIAGGVLLFLTALDMLFERRTARRERRVEDERETPDDDPSVFPLAIPLIAGPGAIAAMILLTGGAGGPGAQAMVFAMMGTVLALQLALFLLGGAIERALGRTGTMVVTRLLGMLLAALAVQFVLDGLANAPPFAHLDNTA